FVNKKQKSSDAGVTDDAGEASTRFSLIVEETTDVSIKKCIVLVARFYDGVSSVQDVFIVLLEMTKADA
ncbi:hypothetical protein DOY81_014000, partial [Sarcophaga bullata]